MQEEADNEMLSYMMPNAVSIVNFYSKTKRDPLENPNNHKPNSKIISFKDKQRLQYLTSTKQIL